MEDDYFQTDAEVKAQSQLETLADKTQKIAKSLPMHSIILKSPVQAELRWERTKNWRPYANIKES